MKIKTNEATPNQINYLVAKCEGIEYTKDDVRFRGVYSKKYSSDWAQGGPIIEREGVNVNWCVREKDGALSQWNAEIHLTVLNAKGKKERKTIREQGTTPLIAAMRCYIASKLGNEVEIPDELI